MFKEPKREEHDKEAPSYTDFSNVETQRNFLVPEQTPEGAYGSPFEAQLEKTTPWQPGQRRYSSFNYEFKSLHQNLPRQFPGAHPPHDDPDKNEEPPYTEK